MQSLINAIKGIVGQMLASVGTNRIGIVSAVDPARHLARVIVQPEGDQSGWLPVNSHWGILQLPAVGQQVLTAPQEGDGEHMHVLAGVFSSADPPPAAPSASLGSGDQTGNAPTNVTPGTELLLVNKGGAVIRLLPDGSMYFKGNIVQDGNLVVNGDVSDRHGSLDRLRIAHNSHVHSGVQSGGSDTAIPTTQDPE